MKITNNTYYIALERNTNPVSRAIANAMATELACYNVGVDPFLMDRISRLNLLDAKKFCKGILKDYTVGKLNPPLFEDWEERTYFSFGEIVVQICGYMLQLSGNDLHSENYIADILSKVKYSKEIVVKLATKEEAIAKFRELVDVRVSLDKKGQETLKQAGYYFSDLVSQTHRIYSDEARIAVLLGMLKSYSLKDALEALQAKPADVLRYAAALVSFETVKLPSDVLYAKLSWSDRVSLLGYLNTFGYDDLMEAMGNNREAWTRFFKHLHVFNQKDFVKKFPVVGICARVSCGHSVGVFPDKYAVLMKALVSDDVVEILPTGNTVYRTFASRVNTAVESKDYNKIIKLFDKNGGYLLRNLAHISNGISEKDEKKFVEFVRTKLETASPDVLFSIFGINVMSDYRVIDVKGNTVVQPANYPMFIEDIQDDIRDIVCSRWGYDGKVIVEEGLENEIVPFLSKNSNLQRGTRIPFEDKGYLYFFMHWIQQNSSKTGLYYDDKRTDLDHSYIAYDEKWNTNTIYFGNQANDYITHGGDITNAPAPHGATEYGMIRLNEIPKNVRYIVPVINVFCGDVFSELPEAYAGFMFSDNKSFKVEKNHIRYDLTNPANSNIPFIVDVHKREIVILDYNNRERNGFTAHSEIGNLKKLISAVETKNYISIGMLAKMLSGDGDFVDLEVRKIAKKGNEIAPESLATLFK